MKDAETHREQYVRRSQGCEDDREGIEAIIKGRVGKPQQKQKKHMGHIPQNRLHREQGI